MLRWWQANGTIACELFLCTGPFMLRMRLTDRKYILQGSYTILNINFQTLQDLFQTFSGLFPDLTFLYYLPRSNTGGTIFNTI